MSIAQRTLTLSEFLKLPETKPASEYVEGKVVQKVSPKSRHSRTQLGICDALNEVAKPRRLGEAFPELRCTFAGRSLVFDVAYFRWDRIAYGPDGELLDDVFLPPDLAVEILSPGQATRELEERLVFSVKTGVRLGWLIDPGRRRAKLYLPGKRPRWLSPDDDLDGLDVIPGFRCPLAKVFGWLRRP